MERQQQVLARAEGRTMTRQLGIVALILAVALAVAPAVQAQAPTQGSGSTVVTPSFPTYYFTPPVVYGWDPFWRLPYYGYVPYYYNPINPAYYSYWVPAYPLPPFQQSALNYWARTTYVPYYYSYYNSYRPAFYYYGY
jgi:hypothetical protein